MKQREGRVTYCDAAVCERERHPTFKFLISTSGLPTFPTEVDLDDFPYVSFPQWVISDHGALTDRSNDQGFAFREH
jgi:hypothetical protein